jgi:DDE superfamily endonuclease
MGVIATARVVTRTDRAGRPRTVQPGNREWVTIIEYINALGGAIPPLVIFEVVMYQAAWYKDNIIPHDWLIGVSDNSWTTDKIGLTWLSLFHKHTKDRTVGTYRLLVLDGHNSHVNPEFD